MLQQTQVATAIPFYQRFLVRFPTLRSLAQARESEVLAQWSGLGYYRRARHLHSAAREVAREHRGRVPDDPERFGRLPGIGRYTMGAVLSIAFDRPLPVLDGNVARVLARLFAVPTSVRDARGAKQLWRLAETLVPERGAGDWNQALMELGATVCLPRGPRCEECPVRAFCRARARGDVERYPSVTARRDVESVRRAIVVIERDGRLLMARRSGRVLDGMWEPPGVDLGSREPARPRLRKELSRLGIAARLSPTDRVVRHRITHRDIRVEVWVGKESRPIATSSVIRYVDPASSRVAITALARKVRRPSEQ